MLYSSRFEPTPNIREAEVQAKNVSLIFDDTVAMKKSYALVNRARGPYEETFVLTYPGALNVTKKYFPYGPKSWLIKALLYTYINKLVEDEISLSCPVHTMVVRLGMDCLSANQIKEFVPYFNQYTIKLAY